MQETNLKLNKNRTFIKGLTNAYMRYTYTWYILDRLSNALGIQTFTRTYTYVFSKMKEIK